MKLFSFRFKRKLNNLNLEKHIKPALTTLEYKLNKIKTDEVSTKENLISFKIRFFKLQRSFHIMNGVNSGLIL